MTGAREIMQDMGVTKDANDAGVYRVSRARDGYWQWCWVAGADSVYGGFESAEAASADADFSVCRAG
jgi:hypothetical protein